MLKFTITFNVLFDRIFGFVCLGYAILTFSRGGVVVPRVH